MPLPRGVPDLASLDLLLTVAELGSVGKAAAAHEISQPSASARLSRLEREVGLALLMRSTTGTVLTPTGAAFAAWAAAVVDAAEALATNVDALRDARSTRLRVAASLTVAEYLLPAWLLRLRRRQPDLDVTVVVVNSHEVGERVRAGAVDVGFVESPTVPGDLSSTQVGTDRLVLVAAPAYPAARRRRPLRPVDLLDQPLLLRETGSGTRETFVHALTVALDTDEPPVLAHATELGSTATILATARAGGGIGVISAHATRADLTSGSLVPVPVEGLDLERPLSAVWVGRHAGTLARTLVDLAGEVGAPPA